MNAMLLRLVSFLTALCLLSLPISAEPLTVVFVGDSHAHLTPGGSRDATLTQSVGGLARLASFVGHVRATEPNVIALHSGDLSIGDALFASYGMVPELQILASLGFDAVTLGNHEFDLGPSALSEQLETALNGLTLPVLSANAVIPSASLPALASRVQPWVIRSVGSLSVGIFGMTTPSTNFYSQPSPVVIDDDLVTIASTTVQDLKNNGCDVVIMLSHLGLRADEAIAAAVTGIDVVVGGHDHRLTTTPITVDRAGAAPALLVYPGAFLFNAGVLELDYQGTNGVSVLDYRMTPLDENIPEEPSVVAIVDGLVAAFEASYGALYTTAVASVPADLEEHADGLTSDGWKDTPVGNLLADAIRSATSAHVALVPGGSISERFYSGPITPSDVYRVVGYGLNTTSGLGFRVMLAEVPGATLLAGLEFGLSGIEEDDELLLQTSGLRYVYDYTQPVGSRLTLATIAGDPIDPNETYTLAASEFTMMFLVAMDLPYSNMRQAGATDFEILLGAVVAAGEVAQEPDGRIWAAVRPTIDVTLSPSTLWPPSHAMRLIDAEVTTSGGASPLSVELVSVVSSEPDDAPVGGDGSTTNDIQNASDGSDDRSFDVRAERAASGDGRTYTATYRVTDAAGVVATSNATVFVPHSQGAGKPATGGLSIESMMLE